MSDICIVFKNGNTKTEVRTISRKAGSTTVSLWPKHVSKTSVRVDQTGHYRSWDEYGNEDHPTRIGCCIFEDMFGFVPKEGTIDRYLLHVTLPKNNTPVIEI